MRAQRHLPIATLIIVAANIFAAYALLLNPDLAFRYGFKAQDPGLRSAFTSLFLHENVVHLLGNMLFLAAVGASVESLSGSFRLFAVYIVSGFVGVIAHFFLATRALDAPPLIGASGAVAGCVGYYCSRYLQLKVPVAEKLGINVAAVGLVWLALQIIGVFVHLGDSRLTTSFWSHIGGFTAGLLLSFVFRAPDVGQRLAIQQRLGALGKRSPAAVVHAAREHLAKNPNDAIVLAELADAYARLNDTDLEADTLVRLLDALPEMEQSGPALRLCALAKADRLPALRRTLLADRLRASDAGCARALLSSVVAMPAAEPQRPDALLALVALERDENPAKAAALLSELQEQYPLHPATELARARGWL